mgnify:CR=1 FL=1
MKIRCCVRLLMVMLMTAMSAGSVRADEAEPSREERVRATHALACELIAQAEEASSRGSGAGAKEKYRHAAGLFASLAADDDGGLVWDKDLLTNAGVAALKGEDWGRAILFLRRARFTDGFDRRVEHALAEAREKAGVAGPASLSFPERAASYAAVVPQSVRVAAMWIGWCGAWAVLAVRVVTRRATPARWVAAIAFGVAIVGGLTLAPAEIVLAESKDGVIVSSATARRGPDDVAHEQVGSEPLKAGTEVTVLEERGDWAYIELGQSDAAWVPADTVRTVFRKSAE